MRTLTPAQAGWGLMRCLIDARNLPNHGFTAIAQLARQTPARQVRYVDFEWLSDWN